ncbi:HupE/UreJ family protein [Halioxenophilus aromaticivorans]|uniref:HupE/UreJ family protein n=1 Tax=Halioxenophilus aromaticivorans TaxID=1306992 RepID=UPI0031E83468
MYFVSLSLFNNPVIKTTGIFGLLLLALLVNPAVLAHGVDDNTRAFLELNTGIQFVPFLYIGAKHMITGYDHILFLIGVVFFLYRSKDVLVYVSLFTLGHSITLLTGVLANIQINAFLIDAIIGLSVFYKGFDNLGGFKRVLGFAPDTRAMVLVFGLFHGFGLATKLQEFAIPQKGLLANIIAFNVGVEIGQFMALAVVVLLLAAWRSSPSYKRFATVTNTLLMACGVMMVGYQLTGFFVAR